MATSTGRNCKAITKRGDPCQSPTLAGSDWCFFHDPSMVQERAEARAKGGRSRHGRHICAHGHSDIVDVQSMADVIGLLNSAINDCLQLENSIARARAIGALAGTLIKALEFATVEDRLSALESLVSGR